MLLRHVFKGSISASELKTGDLTNIDGGVCKVVVSGPGNVCHIVLFMSSWIILQHKTWFFGFFIYIADNITLDGAKLYLPMNTTMTTASNGVIHFIDKVLLPSAWNEFYAEISLIPRAIRPEKYFIKITLCVELNTYTL